MSQRVCDRFAQLSSDDVNEKLLQTSGLGKNIDISVDTWYDTSGIRNSGRTGLPTTAQSMTLTIEKQTSKDYIVSAFMQSKMCPKGALLRSKGDEPAACPGGDAGCIANVDKLGSLSEYERGHEIGRNIADAGVVHCSCRLHSRWRLALAQGCCAIHAGSQPITPS